MAVEVLLVPTRPATTTRGTDDEHTARHPRRRLAPRVRLRRRCPHRAGLADFEQHWPLTYIAEATPERAVADAAALQDVTADSPTISYVEDGSGRARFTIAVAGRPYRLAELLPPLQSLGLEVLSEQPFELRRPYGLACWVYDFHVAPDTLSDDPHLGARLEDALRAMWSERSEIDAYNQLVVAAGLTWTEAAVMRAYGQYLHQLRTPWGRTLTATMLSAHGEGRGGPDLRARGLRRRGRPAHGPAQGHRNHQHPSPSLIDL